VGFVDEGYRFGQVARSVFDRFQNRNFHTRFYSVYYLGVHSYKHPVSECTGPVKNAYLVGLETGDNEFAMVRLVYCSFGNQWQNPVDP
jgi:predicted ATPase